MLRESSYADLMVRAVAARAKVAPATADIHFSSKNHLIAEVYLDLVRQVPFFTEVNDNRSTRVEKAIPVRRWWSRMNPRSRRHVPWRFSE